MIGPTGSSPDQCFIASNLDFEQLTGGMGFKNFSSTAQLIAGLDNSSVGFGADVRVKVHARIVQPLLDITLLFLGLPLVVRRESHNVFLAIGMCMGITIFFGDCNQPATTRINLPYRSRPGRLDAADNIHSPGRGIGRAAVGMNGVGEVGSR